jgi:hypothetical protein
MDTINWSAVRCRLARAWSLTWKPDARLAYLTRTGAAVLVRGRVAAVRACAEPGGISSP